MEDKIRRQKIMERDEFSWDEKKHIALKSKDKCCHCGKKVYLGHGATVDHFIPISKGGTNQDFNMIMLCETCNKAKGNKIMYPHTYIRFLNPEDKKKTENFFESYVRSYEYIERRNILACDEYQLDILPPVDTKRLKKKGKDIPTIKYALKRVRMDDFFTIDEERRKVTDYFIEYLRRIERLDDEESARKNIEFWLHFGCIYYVENVTGIIFMATVTMREIRRVNGNVEKELYLNCFPKNATDLSYSVARGCMTLIPESLCYEQGIDCIPVTYCFLKQDKNAERLCTSLQMSYHVTNDTIESSVIYSIDERDKSEDNENGYPEKNSDMLEFFDKFLPVQAEIGNWLAANPVYSWMEAEVYLDLTKEDEEEEKDDTFL